MRLPTLLIAIALCSAPVLAADAPTHRQKAAAQAQAALPDSKQIEKELQGLPWSQFRGVIESIPKLKADVDAYGAFGWEYVKANYKAHGWRKNVDRLDDTQKRQLVDLIRSAKAAR